MRKGKKKAPTLDELVEQERECRELLESSLRNLSDEIDEELPEVDDDDDPGYYRTVAAEIALHGRGIDYDAKEWGEAAEALAEAIAKQKKAA